MSAAELDLAMVKPNDPAKVVWTDDGGERTVSGLLGDCYTDRVAVWLPECRDRESLPTATSPVSLRIPLENGLYVVPCLVEREPVLYSLGASLHLRVVEAPSRVQRRQFRRVKVAMDGMPARRIDHAGQPNEETTIDVRDIGGGGLRFRCNEELEVGERLAVTLQLAPDDLVRAVVTVLAHADEPNQYRSQFSSISQRDVQRIVHFVFTQELAERRKTTAQEIRERLSAIPARLIGAHGQTVKVFPIALDGIRPEGVYFSCFEHLYPPGQPRR